MNHDLWKPALMTFRTFYVKTLKKQKKNKELDMFLYCLKIYSGWKKNNTGIYFWLTFFVIVPYVSMETTLP